MKKLIGITLLIAGLGLYGCTPTEEKPAETEGVVDTTTTEALQPAEAMPLAGAGAMGASALDDPDSPLAQRIIYFDYDKADVKNEFRSIVSAHGEFLANNAGMMVTLEGHADERGSREYNIALGERRANSVRKMLVLLGVSANQIKVVSYGEERPAVDGHDEDAWAKNRRVELVYTR